MKEENHASDTQIQQYALSQARLDHSTVKHITQCAYCSGRVVWYQKIAGSVSATAGPVFDFELAQAVLAKLPAPKRRQSTTLVLICCVAICGIAAGLYALHDLDVWLLNAIAGPVATTIYAAVTACGGVFIFLMANLYWEYITNIRRMASTGRLQQNPGRTV